MLQSYWTNIIKGCLQNDPSSQERLYRECYPAMMKVCIRYTRDIDEAGAVYNASMLKVFQLIHQYKKQGVFLGWIRKIVLHTCIDQLRKKTKFTHYPLEMVTDNTYIIQPEIYERLSGKEIIALLKALPVNTAIVFNLFAIEGYRHQEIGQLLGIPEGTSKWHLNEARRLLKKELEKLLKKETYLNEP